MELNINKATKYLFVIFSEESSKFINYYNICNKNNGLKIYIDDFGKEKNYSENVIYLCFDKNNILNFEEKLIFFKFTDNYIDDYIIPDNKHVIVFKISEKFLKSFKHFYKGEYSKMYDNKLIELYFKSYKDYYLKYKSIKILNDIKFSKDKIIEDLGVLKNIKSLEKEINNIYLSPYYVLLKNKELTEIISNLYNTDKKHILELESIPILEQEILRYNIN